MYSNKKSINILTALLVKHGICNAVVCPGSRNAPIVHNLVECEDIECQSVTDERSAGFYALGMAQATHLPVVVCVTSGTALLNLLPAVAEAYYQHVPLIVISADRPPQWIDQLDGQTLPQQDALGRFVKKAVSLPEPHNDEEHWYCNRLINEALTATQQHGGGPVHINVPLTEPLYEFTTKELPDEREISILYPRNDQRPIEIVCSKFWQSKKPMIVVGQISANELMAEDFIGISGFAVVLNESLSIGCGACHFDELLCKQLPKDFLPDFVLYIGNVLVSKRMKQFLRQLPPETPIWAVSEDEQVHDTFQSLDGVIIGHPADVLDDLKKHNDKWKSRTTPFFDRWDETLAETDEIITTFTPGYSQMAAVQCLESDLEIYSDDDYVTHYGNSMAVRLANIYATHYVYCNRGVNGIEGTLSTAAGFSLTTEQTVYCILGDLSFFYDSNALWNEDLRGNLRILLLNNGGGGIFEKFEGLKESAARDRFVMAKHHTSAEGICQSYHIEYLSAHNMDELKEGINWLQQDQNERPMLLEVFTDSANDAKVLKEYYDRFRM